MFVAPYKWDAASAGNGRLETYARLFSSVVCDCCGCRRYAIERLVCDGCGASLAAEFEALRKLLEEAKARDAAYMLAREDCL